MLFAAAATAFVSCQKQEVSVSESSREVTLTFASEKPAFDDDTRTEWTGETIKWSAGDRISVAYTVDGVWQNASGDASDDAKLYKEEFDLLLTKDGKSIISETDEFGKTFLDYVVEYRAVNGVRYLHDEYGIKLKWYYNN